MIQITKAAKEIRKKGINFSQGTKDFAAECGIEGPPSKERIVGGHEAEEHEWPWQVALFIDAAWFCGGSIISDEVILIFLWQTLLVHALALTATLPNLPHCNISNSVGSDCCSLR